MSGAQPIFSRVAQLPLYWLDSLNPITGYLAGSGSTLGTNPTLDDTWANRGGTYLLLGQPIADAVAFLAELEAYLDAFHAGGAPRFLWILQPNQGYLTWSVRELTVAPGHAAGSWVIAQRVDFDFSDNALIVRSGGTIGPADGGELGWGFALGDSASSAPLTFYSTDGQFDAASGTSSLCMAGDAAGCWRARLDLPASLDANDAFVQLGCSIRYFTALPESGQIHALTFQVLRQPDATPFSLYANLDAQRPLDTGRTNFGFFSWSSPQSAPAFSSGYATARGHAVDLIPQAFNPAGAPPARLVFAIAPFYATESSPGGYYLTLEGGFGLGIVARQGGTSAIERLVCGASALEYLGVPSTGGATLLFVPGQAAYADHQGNDGLGALTVLGTTAWVYAAAPSGQRIGYFAQPEDAPFYTARDAIRTNPEGGEGATPFLDFLEVRASTLSPPAPGLAFPMAPFRNLPADMLLDALQVEQLALAPWRRSVLTRMATAQVSRSSASLLPPPVAEKALPVAATLGVTPQGLAVAMDADGQHWVWSAFGQTAANGAEPDLRFTSVTGEFRQALLTNNLFMVMGNAEVFNTAGSVEYRLTLLDLEVIETLPGGGGLPADVIADVRSYMATQGYPVYIDLLHFRAALNNAHPGITDAQARVFQRFAGRLSPVVDGWTFRMSPDNWTSPGRRGQTNAYLIYKFNLGRSLADMAADVSTWAWPEVASPTSDPSTASADILQIIATAAGRTSAGNALYVPFNQLVNDPNWTGVLALSVEVPLDQLPAPLQPLAAGIDPGAFYAHHVGIAATPYQLLNGALDFQRSTLFGLIDYENQEHQYFAENIRFAFRVLQLSVGFQNSVVTTFASRVELMINRLFGAPARLFPTSQGNNIILTGAHQVQTLPDGSEHDTYVFAMDGQNEFALDGLVLQSVQLIATDMVTAQAASEQQGATVTATFRMSGNLRFFEPDHFDPFCWGPADDGTDGYLRFGNLSVDMQFNLGDPENTTVFRLNDGALSFDPANSVARPNSLVRRFPVRLAALITTPDPALPQAVNADPAGAPLSPERMGFVSVSAPIDQSVLSEPWYGLNYTIDLGTLGALAGSASISLSVLAGWSPGVDGVTPSMYIGVKLPGTKEAFGVSLPVQGILKLGFRSIEFLVDNPQGQPRTYTLRLRDFALRVLGLSFPSGHNDIVLFGNTDQNATDKVGWYAAYAQDDAPATVARTTRNSVSQVRALPRPNRDAQWPH